MNRLFAVVAIVGLLVGALGGYLWWGMRTQGQLREAQGQTLAVQSDLKAAQDRLKALEAQLGQERDRRQKLEEIVAKGRK